MEMPPFLIILLSSGVVAAIISGIITAVMQKRNEKESRIFNAKLEAYKEFAEHLQSRFASIANKGNGLDITILRAASAKCLLVSSGSLNKELKLFLGYVSEAYEKISAPDYDTKNDLHFADKIWEDGEKIEELMRQDLGF